MSPELEIQVPDRGAEVRPLLTVHTGPIHLEVVLDHLPLLMSQLTPFDELELGSLCAALRGEPVGSLVCYTVRLNADTGPVGLLREVSPAGLVFAGQPWEQGLVPLGRMRALVEGLLRGPYAGWVSVTLERVYQANLCIGSMGDELAVEVAGTRVRLFANGVYAGRGEVTRWATETIEGADRSYPAEVLPCGRMDSMLVSGFYDEAIRTRMAEALYAACFAPHLPTPAGAVDSPLHLSTSVDERSAS